MTSNDFCYFLLGVTETIPTAPTAAQWKVVQDKLNSVFNKVTPNRSVISPASWEANLRIYNPPPDTIILDTSKGNITGIQNLPMVLISC